MPSQSLRTITLAGVVYRWQVRHHHDPTEHGRRCSEIFSAFLPGFRRVPLRVFFRDSPTGGGGYPGQAGVVLDCTLPIRTFNLNRPLLARTFIELGLAAGWAPRQQRGPFVVVNGFQFIAEHASTLAPNYFA